MSQRKLHDWISTYLEYTEDTEPPESYHKWVAISVIAAALQRRVYLDWGLETIYPNLYIVLVGPSGRARKGTAITIGQDILQDLKIAMTSESTTREALIKDMKDAETTYNDPESGKIKFHCSITAISEELSVFLGQNDLNFLSNLTNWYDSRDVWEYRTKNAGTDKIEGVCVNLLGGTAPDWLQSILPQEAVGGGFTSRVIFVVADKKRKTVVEPVRTPHMAELRAILGADLERIATLAGSMKFDDSGREAYTQWYMKHEEAMNNGKPPIDDPRFSGYLERRATHVRKLSMIMSASRGDDRIITGDDFRRADTYLREIEPEMSKTFGGLGLSPYGQITDKILQYVKRKGKVDKSEIARVFYRDADLTVIDMVEKTLEQMKVIKVEYDVANKNKMYVATDRS